MKTSTPPQCRIVPIRMLHPENAAQFLEGLSYIPGIQRMLVHGPTHYADLPGGTQNSCEIQPPEYAEVTIMDQVVNMHVLMGDVIVEVTSDEVIEKVAAYCKEFFENFPYQILIGKFIKTEPSLSDFIKNGPEPERILIGMSDYQNHIETVMILGDSSDHYHT
jgi:methyl-coenzyme M reductase subunit D